MDSTFNSNHPNNNRAWKHSVFSTRCLPRSSVHIDFRYCMFTGSLDLLSLPFNLQYLDASVNEVMGIICMTKLPPLITHILADEMKSITVVLSNAALPDSLHVANSSARKLRLVEISGERVSRKLIVEKICSDFMTRRQLIEGT